MQKRIVAIAALLALAACSAQVSGRPARGSLTPPVVSSSSSAARAKPAAHRIVSAWVDRSFRPVGDLVSVRGGFATYAFDPVHKAFEVLGLRGSDGAVRWRAPASPSNITPGVGIFLAAHGNTVIYQRPGAHPRTGEVSVVAVDGTTGHPLWTRRSGLDLSDNVSICDSGRHVCLHEGLAAEVLDLRTGESVDSAFLDARRNLGTQLYDEDPSHLARITAHGHEVWSHPIAWLFPGMRVSSEDGWDFVQNKGRYIGWLGAESPQHGTGHLLPTSTAAFRISDGKPLWHRPGLELFCDEQLHISAQDLVGCEMSGGSITYRGDNEHYNHVTLALVGIDPATGKDRWRWDMKGPARSAIQVGANQYVFNLRGDLFVLDPATGVRRYNANPVGWCRDFGWMTPRVLLEDYPKAAQSYAVGQIRPCTAEGRHPVLPANLPDFAVTRSAGVAAWSQSDGVHAAIER
jgi:outer membrane protein assembly factor BamB